MSLRVRLLLVVASTFAIVVVGCGYAVRVSASRELRSETDHFLLQRAHEPDLAHTLDDYKRDPPSEHQPGPLSEPDAIVQRVAADGTVQRFVTNQPQMPVDARDREIASRGAGSRFRDATVNGTAYRVLTMGLASGGAVQIARSVTETNNVLSSLDLRLLLIALIGTAVAAALAWLIARRIVRPVEQLTTAAERVAETQDLEHRIDVARRDELGRLATSFNTMLVALGASREQQHRLVMDASHELRTPLTALRTNIEMLQRTGAPDPQQAELVAAARVELVELTDLVAELVDLATDVRTEEPSELVELGSLVERVVERQRRRVGRTISFSLVEPATVDARASALDHAVTNPIDNACKFSAGDTVVDVVVDHASVEVRDRGPGIPQAVRQHVFDRFYRAPTARTTPGSGLGLAIVKQIVELHGGTVELLDRAGGGLVARISLVDAPQT